MRFGLVKMIASVNRPELRDNCATLFAPHERLPAVLSGRPASRRNDQPEQEIARQP